MKKNIGVLAVQGAFIEHIHMLNQLDVRCIEIRNKSDLKKQKLDGIVLPGGESTAMSKIMHDLDLFKEIKSLISSGTPTLGTCAGMILLSKRIVGETTVHLGIADTLVKRNAYGRQLGSFSINGYFKGIGNFPMVFIRAPYIESISGNVEILATHDDKIVAVRQDHIIMTAFHPELTSDTRIHQFFLSLIK